MDLKIGQAVELVSDYLGYNYGTIIGYEYPYYQVELSSGKVLDVFRDQIL